ncbi:hypothetical protein GS399_16750 [Pedobacter sp. HMF7647]|uniref:Probable sensor domain-containing protein n=1 Tax=Hufsiella arboris TaxID=2695275 RepID=A0A7K1YDF4_9SPHI|nr:hypothetical protein [Hufsiella arboris]MXV52625.1 hypothetical protein [Hufsiella arboris]
MVYKSTYETGRTVAEIVEKHFSCHIDEAGRAGQKDLAPVPDAKVAESIIDAAFWASLRKEEGHSPRISIAYLPPSQAGEPLVFEKSLPLSPSILTKVAPGVERPGIHLGVWIENGELCIWGTTLQIPNFCFVLDVSEPGLIVIKHRRLYGFGKFTNVLVLKGDEVKVINEKSANLPDSPAIVKSLLGLSNPTCFNDSVNVLIQLAVSMRNHQRGGILLVVPAATDVWKESIIHPVQYAVEPTFFGLSGLLRKDKTERSQSQWQGLLNKQIEHLAGLTAVDGATVVTELHELLAFGAKIGRSERGSRVERMIVTEPIVGNEEKQLHPAQNGGTRHLAAAQFIHDQHDAIALVASQDGHFTVFSWSDTRNIVLAHRIDTLLL